MFDLIKELREEPFKLEQVPDEACMLYALVLSRKPTRILEIGVRNGGSSLLMAHALDWLQQMKLSPLPGHIDAVDADGRLPTKGTPYENLRRYITLVRQHSPEGVPSRLYDLVHIDGNHNTPKVFADLERAASASHPDTVIILHDANFSGVRQGIIDFATSNARAQVHMPWTKRLERADDWGGQALITFRKD